MTDSDDGGVRKDDSRKLFVGGLSHETTEQDMHDYFMQFGMIRECVVMISQNTGLGRGFGFVIFEDDSSAHQVLTKTNHILDGKAIDPKRPKCAASSELRSTVYVGGLDASLSETKIRDYFGKFGKIIDIEFPFDKHGNERRNFCYITFEAEEVMRCICKQMMHVIGGTVINVKKAKVPNRIKASDSLLDRGHSQNLPVLNGLLNNGDSTESISIPKIFVGHLNSNISESMIRNYFESFGRVVVINLPLKKRTNERQSYCFVGFETQEIVSFILKQDVHIINGHILDVKCVTVPQNPHKGESNWENPHNEYLKTRLNFTDPTKVFVGGLDQIISEDNIRAYFEMFGPVVSMEMPFDKQKNQRRGYCFVKFASEQIVGNILEQSKHIIDGNAVDVKTAGKSTINVNRAIPPRAAYRTMHNVMDQEYLLPLPDYQLDFNNGQYAPQLYSAMPSRSGDCLPQLIVFDLDKTLWPFWIDSNINLPCHMHVNGIIVDNSGKFVHPYQEVPAMLHRLYSCGVTLAVASRTSEINGAFQLIQLFGWHRLLSYWQIYPGSKVAHFTNLNQDSGIAFRDMLFFDDEKRNIVDVSKLGVPCVHAKYGMNESLLAEALYKWSETY